MLLNSNGNPEPGGVLYDALLEINTIGLYIDELVPYTDLPSELRTALDDIVAP